MTRKIVYLLLLTAIGVALLAVSALAKAVFDSRGDKRVDNVTSFSFPRTDRELTRDFEFRRDTWTPAAERQVPGRISLGTAGTAADPVSPGITVRTTYEDWQGWAQGRRIEFAAPTHHPSIHFTYATQDGAQAPSGWGYNVYDPTGGGDWPRGIGTGVRIQPVDEAAGYPTMAVYPDGKIVLAGNDGPNADHHLYSNLAPHAAYWGAGSQLERDQYGIGFLHSDSTSTMRYPMVAQQIFGSDTITHFCATEQYCFLYTGTENVCVSPLNYFRRFGTEQLIATTTWEGPITIDTVDGLGFGPVIVASPNTGKVAIAYGLFTATAVENDEDHDKNIFYRESTNGGVSFAEKVNITNYDRTQPSYAPWMEMDATYDSEDHLHIVWEASPWPANPYDDPDFFFGDFTASLFHWSDRTDVISRVANREYGIEWNTQVCGFGGYNNHYLGASTIGECNGRLYVFYQGFHDIWADPPVYDDCASSGDRGHIANNEVFMRVSTTLDGMLWDAERNITNSYTPGCDSAGGGGICMNDWKPRLAPFGLDSSAWGQALTFPESEYYEVDTSSPYTGSHFANLFYLEDHHPVSGIDGQWTNNDLKWVRIGCVDPITAPEIAYDPRFTAYPDWIHHGEADTITVTVTNDGNTALEVDTIVPYEESPQSGWLTISETSLTIQAGQFNTATFDVYLNDDQNINSPGTIVALSGEVYMLSNANSPRDSVSFLIDNFLIADTVVGLVWDTLSTEFTARSPEALNFLSLIVSSHGEMGRNGDGNVNLDYVSLDTLVEGDCDDDADVYLYSGSPLLLQAESGDTSVSFSMHSGGFARPEAYKPVAHHADPAFTSEANYDAFFSGTFVNWDSTVAMEKTVYAPTNADNSFFMIEKLEVFAFDTAAHDSLVIGEIIDWDIPGDLGSANKAYPTSSARTIYFQGTDTADVGCDPPAPDDSLCDCQDNTARFGALDFLGMYSNTEYNADTCANDRSFHGVYAGLNDSTQLFADDSLVPGILWNLTDTIDYVAGSDADSTDIHGVMTFVHGVNLGATDTLVFYTALTTVQNGTSADIQTQLDSAAQWYEDYLRPGCVVTGCCVGMTGNVDGDEAMIVDIGDLTALIAYLFIPPNPEPDCLDEANVDGDEGGVIDIGDLTALIAYLFIPPNPLPANCQ